MLKLKTASPRRWLALVDQNLEEVLIDHAHCEKKAAAAAMSLIQAYGARTALAHELADIVIEEMQHFRLVLDELELRAIAFRPLKPSGYGRSLNELVRSNEPDRAVDRLLVAGLIEARSCERFSLLSEHVQDARLASFYGNLFESEARHHSTYMRLAKLFASSDEVEQRLEQLAAAEAEIIAAGDSLPRMHS